MFIEPSVWPIVLAGVVDVQVRVQDVTDVAEP
jgi:hypothetical protein